MKSYKMKISRQTAIKIVANHNCMSIEDVSKYTDSELNEVLRQLNLSLKK
jgi:hypothetical protein